MRRLAIIMVLSALAAPVGAQGVLEAIAIRSCTASLTPEDKRLLGTEGAPAFCSCTVKKLASKYTGAEQKRLSDIPKTRGELFAANDPEYRAWVQLVAQTNRECARDVADPGWEARESAEAAREAAREAAQHRADSLRQRTADSVDLARRNSPESVMKGVLVVIDRMERAYYQKVGGACLYKQPRCPVFFGSIAELTAAWSKIRDVQLFGPLTDTQLQAIRPPGVTLVFTNTEFEYVVTASHEATSVRCAIGTRSNYVPVCK